VSGDAARAGRSLDVRRAAAALGELARRRSKPRSPKVHLDIDGAVPRMLVVDGSRMVDLSQELAGAVQRALADGDEAALDSLLARLGLDGAPAIDDVPLESPPLHALSLAVAQGCNLACSYCYAQQGTFGGPSRRMASAIARRSVDLLLEQRAAGDRVNLAFLGGEPLSAREVLRDATTYAAARAAERGIDLTFSMTTNGTLLTPEDAEFFEAHGFAVTISLDGVGAVHDRLRPFRSGAGSFDRIMARVRPLLDLQARMQVSARVTVTPSNRDLLPTLEHFIAAGFHSVGFSPLLRSSSGTGELQPDDLVALLDAMIACGLAFEQAVLEGRRYPFANMLNALRELQRRTHRPYPCGAGAGYLAVSAGGDLAACHRFVEDPAGSMGDLDAGVDASAQNRWLAQRHVHQQQPCTQCWARYLCGGGCHHEVLARGRTACDFIRGWLHYVIQAHGRLERVVPGRVAALR
jgi:uncharacterized protein